MRLNTLIWTKRPIRYGSRVGDYLYVMSRDLRSQRTEHFSVVDLINNLFGLPISCWISPFSHKFHIVLSP